MQLLFKSNLPTTDYNHFLRSIAIMFIFLLNKLSFLCSAFLISLTAHLNPIDLSCTLIIELK
jgi:hypothetical protein